MAYDEGLAQRIREALTDIPQLAEKKMFGGTGFLLNGNMACGVHKDNLVVRVGPQAYETALDQEHSAVFDLTGRAMHGWVLVAPEGLDTDESLADWVSKGVAYARTLPPK